MRVASSLSRVLTLPTRSAAAAALKPKYALADNSLSVVESDGGLQYACCPKPNPWNGLTRLVAIFNAGSRFEKVPHIHGITHLIRRSCGLSTTNYTAVNLTRHIQQMGGRLRCHTTPSRAALILATMATRTAFFDWELRDQVYKLMKKDIDMVNRRRFDASYGQHPDGVGLGNSLFANLYRIGTYTIDDIETFFDDHYTPVNTAFLVTGCNPSEDGLQICDAMHDAALLRPNKPACTTVAKHTFVGGERRPVLTSPHHHVVFGSMGGFVPSSSPTATSTPIHFTYSDHGLFGILVTGRDGRVVAEHLRLARRVIAQMAETGIDEEQFKRAKALFKADWAMRMENFITLTEDIAVQLLCCNKGGGGGDLNVSGVRSVEDVCSAVDRLSLSEANKVFKETVKSERMALSTHSELDVNVWRGLYKKLVGMTD
ncbi:Cytochrome b-c1 complex subunit 2 mitochondrial [Taenia crassiceps]|uniref:Cytochrome b-c1 complex subunit 2 mitochondrial n=1 Tax=Taenia crassiceps TaxID=6207 RepID=A0ABR4QCA2_9CEST